MGRAIPIDGKRLAEFCRQRHIRKLSSFGSVLRDDVLRQAQVQYAEG